MRLSVKLNGSLKRMMDEHYRDGEKAVSKAMKGAALDLKSAWRGQVTERFGQRLGKTVRSQVYPQNGVSMSSAAQVWSKADKIVSAHEEGSLIRSRNGFWLAIPLPAAGVQRFNRKMTPAAWEQRTGLALRFVYRRGRNALLVADDARISKRSGRAARKGGKRRKSDGILTGAQTVPIFVLVPQVKLPKRLSLMRAADRIANSLPARIEREWSMIE